MTANPALPDIEPPHDLGAERAVLGAILLNPSVADQVLPNLRPSHFYRPWHGDVLHAAQDLHNSGRSVDPVTVHAELARRGVHGEPGRNCGVLIHDLISSVPVTTSGPHYAQIVLEHAARRRLIQAGTKLIQLAQHGARGDQSRNESLDDLMSDVVHEIACVRAAVDTYHRSEPQLSAPARSRPPEHGRSLRSVGPDR